MVSIALTKTVHKMLLTQDTLVEPKTNLQHEVLYSNYSYLHYSYLHIEKIRYKKIHRLLLNILIALE